MHALVVEVQIDTTRAEEAQKLLHEQVVPAVSAAPGFVAGYWMGSPANGRGTSVAVFESEEAARAAMENAPRPPGGAPVTVARFEMMPVVAHA